MKKRIGLLVLLVLFIMTGCEKKETIEQEERTIITSDAGMNFLETKEGYYTLRSLEGGNFIYFADKENMSWIPLCARPDCNHDKSGGSGAKDCNAYCGGTPNIGIYDGMLYYITSGEGEEMDYVIWRMRRDGTAHEEYGELPMIEHRDNVGYSGAFYNGHYIYFTDTTDYETDTYKIELRDYSLATRESKVIDSMVRTNASSVKQIDVGYSFYCGQNQIFVEKREYEETSFLSYDLEQGKLEKIKDGWTPGIGAFFEGNIVYHAPYKDGVKKMDLETGEETYIHKFSDQETGAAYTDGEYYYYGNINYYLGVYLEAPEENTLSVYDMEWNLIQTAELPESSGLTYFASTEDKVFFKEGQNSYPTVWMDKRELSEGNIQLKD